MKISVDEHRNILLEEVFNGIVLLSTNKEHFGICMSDGGYEFHYGGKWYSAKDGKIKELVSSTSDTGENNANPIYSEKIEIFQKY